jgi:hypothetical protein
MTVVRTDLIPNLYPNLIVGISKANPAVVTVPVISRVASTTGTIGTVRSALNSGVTTFATVAGTATTAAATYVNRPQAATSGTGAGAIFTIAKSGSGTAYSGAITVTVTNPGNGYAAGDTITIAGEDLGGASPTNNLTLTLNSGSLSSTGPWVAAIINMTTTAGLQTGQIITATDGVGSFAAGGEVSIARIAGNQSIVLRKVGGTIPTAGTITNITLPAVSSLPAGIADGAIIEITGVEGMTQLTTAGANNTNWYYIDVLTPTTFALYRNVGLTTAVNSTGFTTAVANTGQYTTLDTVVITTPDE